MQITYENTFDYWVATQLFNVGQLSSLKKFDNKNFIRHIIYMLVTDAFVFFTAGPDIIFKIFTIFIILWILTCLFLRYTQMQRLIYQRLKIGYRQTFENEKDKAVQWEITPEQIIVRSVDIETRFALDSIRKITVCPQYVFIRFGFDSYAALPREAVAEAEYNAFCAYLIELYQAHAKQHEKEAAIIQSDWTVDIAALSAKASAKTSLKRIFFTLVWGLVFLTIGILFFGMLAFAVMILQASTELLPCNIEALTPIVVGGLLIGSALFGLTGLILGLRAKLPGTK
jgi:hypothetical protein